MAEERWTARDSHMYFDQRPWEPVLKFYELLIRGETSLSNLRFEHNEASGVKEECIESHAVSNFIPKSNSPKSQRRTFKVVLCYSGTAFTGWQKQPGSLTVQSVLEKVLGRFVDGKRARHFEEQGKLKEALVSVAGRTDKGVHASGQVCSFYTWLRDCQAEDVKAAVNTAMPCSLRALSASEVDRDFHPIFSARWRRYIYMLPLNSENEIDITKVSKLLQALEGLSLSYAVFARDTKISRSSGPATFCTMYHARAAAAELPSEQGKVMVVELVADRFLRKMVRVLVATAVREATSGACEDGLLLLMKESDRRVSAPPAPPHGLCLVQVGYEEFSSTSTLII